MGYILIKQNGKDQYFVNEYIIDSVDDLQTINVTSVSPGSKAYLLKDNKKYIYILDTQKLWKYAGEEGGGGGGGGGTTDYSDLSNKPKINSITLEGNKNSAQLGLQDELNFTYKDTGSPLEIVDYPSRSDFPATGDSHIIYHALDTNIYYEWTGTTYQEVYGTLALGETEHTAYRGDRGKTAYDTSQSNKTKIENLEGLKYQTIQYNSSTGVLSFWKNDGTGAADFTVTIPEGVDISGKLDKLNGSAADEGKVVIVGADGEIVVMSNVMLSDLATKQELNDAIIGIFVPINELPTASASTMGKIYLVPNANGTKDEYVTIRSGSVGSYTYSWEEIGTTDIDLSGYVPTSRTIAGVDLVDNVTKSELLAALNIEDGANKTVVDLENNSITADTVTMSQIWTGKDYRTATMSEVRAIFPIN